MPNKNCRPDCSHACCNYEAMDVGCRLYPDDNNGPASCYECHGYVPRGVPFPAIVSALRIDPVLPEHQGAQLHPGEPVRLQLHGDTKTHIGLYAGDIPVRIAADWTDTVLTIKPQQEQAFYVIPLGRLVFHHEITRLWYNTDNGFTEIRDGAWLDRLLHDVLASDNMSGEK